MRDSKKAIWDKMAKSFHLTSTKSKAHRDKYTKISDFIFNLNPSSVLDLGCGSGILETELLSRNFEGKIVGIDASSEMLKIANNVTNKKNCLFLKQDIEEDSWPEESFDVIVSINLFFFLDKKEDFLRKVREKLEDDNSLFLMVTPKPNEVASNWEFVREHFAGANFSRFFLIFISELINIPRYLAMIIRQKKLSKMARDGVIKYDKLEDIEQMSKNANLDIISTEDIHAKQNWLFVMRRA